MMAKGAATAVLPLTEQAYRVIRQAIVQGEFAPDERLRVEEISSRYGFSSSPVREALARLVEQGLVRAIENRGFRAAPVSITGLRDLMRMRLLVEPEALRLSIDQGDDQWEESMVAAAHGFRLARQRLGGGPGAVSQAYAARYRTLYLAVFSACQSPLMLKLIEQYLDGTERYWHCFAGRGQADHYRIELPQDLLDAVLARDKRAAANLLKKYITDTQIRMVDLIQQKPEK